MGRTAEEMEDVTLLGNKNVKVQHGLCTGDVTDLYQ